MCPIWITQECFWMPSDAFAFTTNLNQEAERPEQVMEDEEGHIAGHALREFNFVSRPSGKDVNQRKLQTFP